MEVIELRGGSIRSTHGPAHIQQDMGQRTHSRPRNPDQMGVSGLPEVRGSQVSATRGLRDRFVGVVQGESFGRLRFASSFYYRGRQSSSTGAHIRGSALSRSSRCRIDRALLAQEGLFWGRGVSSLTCHLISLFGRPARWNRLSGHHRVWTLGGVACLGCLDCRLSRLQSSFALVTDWL